MPGPWWPHFCQAFDHQAIIVRAVGCHDAQRLTCASLQGDLKCSPLIEVIREAAPEEAKTAGHGGHGHSKSAAEKFHGTGGRVAVWVEASVNPNSLPLKKMAATSSLAMSGT